MARAMATAGRNQRRVSQQRISKDQLLDAAEEVFADKGFYATTLKEIADLAEVAVGSLYSFFTGKDDLFAAVLHRRGEEFVPAMRALLTSDDPPVEQLHQLAEYQIVFFRKHPAFGRLFLRTSAPTKLLLEPDRDEASNARFAEAMSLEAAMFKRGQDAGQLRAGDPHVLGHLFSGVIASYQACDPVVVDGAPAGTERFELRDLHALLDDAFTADRRP